MTRSVKVFKASIDPNEEPHPFQLEFTNIDNGDVQTFDFAAQANPGAGGDLTVTAIVRYDDHGKRITDLNGLTAFFKRVLVPGDWERMQTLLDDATMVVPLEMLGDVFGWLVEEYSGRPTRQSTRSSNGGRTTGLRSTAPLSSVDSTSTD